jgi:hypothetical protein
MNKAAYKTTENQNISLQQEGNLNQPLDYLLLPLTDYQKEVILRVVYLSLETRPDHKNFPCPHSLFSYFFMWLSQYKKKMCVKECSIITCVKIAVHSREGRNRDTGRFKISVSYFVVVLSLSKNILP